MYVYVTMYVCHYQSLSLSLYEYEFVGVYDVVSNYVVYVAHRLGIRRRSELFLYVEVSVYRTVYI
jgi:hypothetical protein